MAFTATARIPTRPLSYSNSSMATKKDTSDEIEKENAQLFFENQTGEDY